MAQSLPPSQSLSLSEAIKIARIQNPMIAAVRAEVEASESNVITARSGLLPQLNVSENFQHTTNPMWAFGTKLNQGSITQQDFDPEQLNEPDAINNFATVLSMAWSVYDGGQSWTAFKQSQQGLEASRLSVKKTEQEIIAKTATAYVGVLLADKNLAVVNQALETAKAHLSLVQSRFKSGFVVKSDLLRAQVRIAELEQQRLQAESQILIAKANLNAAMGISEDQVPNLLTPLQTGPTLADSQQQWLDRALSNRPDLSQIKIQRDIAEKEITRSKSGHLPQFQVNGAYEVNSEDFSDTADNYSLGATLTMNLYSGNRVSSQTRAAKALLRRIKAMQEALSLGIRVEIREAYLSAQSAWQRIEVAKTAVAQAEEGLRIVANRYENGLLTMVSVLDAEVADQQARTLHFQALHDYQVARINLAKAAGMIDENFE
jgi:TolC family type I secretion outer membrane protein